MQSKNNAKRTPSSVGVLFFNVILYNLHRAVKSQDTKPPVSTMGARTSTARD